MKQLLLGALAGAVILFVWGFLAWAVLPLHKASFRPVPNEDAVVSALGGNIGTGGVYYFPGIPEETANTSAEQRKANMDAYVHKHQAGPIGVVMFHPGGADPMMVGQFIGGFIIYLIAAFIASWFLSRSTAAGSTYIARVAFCGTLGVFVSFAAHLPAMNWTYFPMDYTTAMVADALIGWLLAGLALAAIVKAPKMQGA